jgi:hypothetical protein
MVAKIISGGQTGADTGGLKAAYQLGIPTGGAAPMGYKTEDGSNFELRDKYNLSESFSSEYANRTGANVKISDATVIFATNTKSPGTKLTIKKCEELKKPYILVNPDDVNASKIVSKFFETMKIKYGRKITLNVAGNRETKSSGIENKVEKIMITVLQK